MEQIVNISLALHSDKTVKLENHVTFHLLIVCRFYIDVKIIMTEFTRYVVHYYVILIISELLLTYSLKANYHLMRVNFYAMYILIR